MCNRIHLFEKIQLEFNIKYDFSHRKFFYSLIRIENILGEQMRNRRIVSMTQVRCLLIPRYWLLEQNRANIWERVKLFMNSKYPTADELFQIFISNRR